MQETRETLEGRVLAHRKILGMMVAALGETGDGVRAFLEDRSQFRDGEEDPGAVPSEALSIELAIADEIRLVLEESRRSR